ncbi:hypothetical protein DBV15_08659 [Temnothorax longispinosus]|uniref:Uncharacterized protein n=1 Tax=Temnothorax longispinosus TaxID=300112 RepID=A0A4S2KK58_9HYME|nr:hypothetical protein DBV15_08659 [Temnothorax longispinosus]
MEDMLAILDPPLDDLPIHDSSVDPSLMGMMLSGSWSCGRAIAEKPNAMPVLMVPSWATRAATTCLTALPLGVRGSSGSPFAAEPFAARLALSSLSSADGWIFGSSAESTSEVFSGSCTPLFFL